MSFPNIDPFNANFPEPANLNQLAYIATGIFGARAFQYGIETVAERGGITEALRIPQKWDRSFTQTKTKMKYPGKKYQRKLATVAGVKRMISGVLEKKQNVFATVTTFPLADNNAVFSTNLTAKITQGSTDGSRVGDVIELTSLEMNVSLITAIKGTYYRYRILVLMSGEEYNAAFGKTNLGATEIFVVSGVDTFSQVINNKACRVLYDNMVEINSLLDTVNEGKTIRVSVPFGGRKFEYQKSSDTFGKKENLYLVIVPSYNGLAPLDIGAVTINSVLKYTDA